MPAPHPRRRRCRRRLARELEQHNSLLLPRCAERQRRRYDAMFRSSSTSRRAIRRWRAPIRRRRGSARPAAAFTPSSTGAMLSPQRIRDDESTRSTVAARGARGWPKSPMRRAQFDGLAVRWSRARTPRRRRDARDGSSARTSRPTCAPSARFRSGSERCAGRLEVGRSADEKRDFEALNAAQRRARPRSSPIRRNARRRQLRQLARGSRRPRRLSFSPTRGRRRLGPGAAPPTHDALMARLAAAAHPGERRAPSSAASRGCSTITGRWVASRSLPYDSDGVVYQGRRPGRQDGWVRSRAPRFAIAHSSPAEEMETVCSPSTCRSGHRAITPVARPRRCSSACHGHHPDAAHGGRGTAQDVRSRHRRRPPCRGRHPGSGAGRRRTAAPDARELRCRTCAPNADRRCCGFRTRRSRAAAGVSSARRRSSRRCCISRRGGR